MNIKKIQAGFTLIELVMVMVIVGILAAVALPKYMDTSAGAKVTAGHESSMNFRAAHGQLVAQNAGTVPLPAEVNPTLTVLKGQLGGTAALATDNSGICTGTAQIVKTFTDSAKTTPTAAAGAIVRGYDDSVSVSTAVICP